MNYSSIDFICPIGLLSFDCLVLFYWNTVYI